MNINEHSLFLSLILSIAPFRYIYWSDIGTKTIERSNKYGNGRIILYRFRRDTSIDGVTLAISNNRLYILQRTNESGKVFSITLTGEDRRDHIFVLNEPRNTFSVVENEIFIVSNDKLHMKIFERNFQSPATDEFSLKKVIKNFFLCFFLIFSSFSGLIPFFCTFLEKHI